MNIRQLPVTMLPLKQLVNNDGQYCRHYIKYHAGSSPYLPKVLSR